MSIVNRIKELAQDKNITIAELERKCAFGNGTIRRWDERAPSIYKVITVANYLMVSAEFLATGIDNLSLCDANSNLKEIINRFQSLDDDGKKCVIAEAIHQQQRMEDQRPGRYYTDKGGMSSPSPSAPDSIDRPA
jgi:transcriptional regulator with XRE-family HTH domain